MGAEEWLTTSQADEKLDYGKKWIAALCRQGALEGKKEQGQWRIRRSSLEKFMNGKLQVQDKAALEEAADEIKNDSEVLRHAIAEAKEPFMDRVIFLSQKYGLGATLFVAGVFSKFIFPVAGNTIVDTGAKILEASATSQRENFHLLKKTQCTYSECEALLYVRISNFQHKHSCPFCRKTFLPSSLKK